MPKCKVRVAKCSCFSAHNPAAAPEPQVQSLPAFLSQSWPGQGLAEVQSSVSEGLPALSAVLSDAVGISNSWLKITSTNNKNFPFSVLVCQMCPFIKEGTFWKESLNCSEITCWIIEQSNQTLLKELTSKIMHAENSACLHLPSSWDLFKWGKIMQKN